MSTRIETAPLPPAHRLIGRALRTALRRGCPNCGDSRVWESWLTLRERCPNCGIAPARGEHDFFIGAVMVNFVVAELIVVFAFIGTMIATWPDPNWDLLLWGTAALAVVAPVVTYPFTMSFWLAMDMTFRPPGREN